MWSIAMPQDEEMSRKFVLCGFNVSVGDWHTSARPPERCSSCVDFSEG
jgi:hypothetical protein